MFRFRRFIDNIEEITQSFYSGKYSKQYNSFIMRAQRLINK